MNWSAKTYENPQTINVTITTKQPEKIWLEVVDFDNRKRKFTQRYFMINGTETLSVMMPISPKKIFISVFNDRNGKTTKDESFTVDKISRSNLKQKLSISFLQQKKVRSFLKFSQNFCYYLQELCAKGEKNEKGESASGVYKSNDKQFFIELFPTIKDSSGNELNTPARINKETGVIQVSKKQFYNLTIPEMMAILLHEFSHFNMSEDIDNETEADLYGLTIYLALGYPRQEAMEAWAGVFENANTQQNQKRYKIIDDFIRDFENNKI
jgi:hypothetical protein